MSYLIKNSGRLKNFKKGDYSHLSYKKENNFNSFYHQYIFPNYNCKCLCHNNYHILKHQKNNFINKNSQIQNNSQKFAKNNIGRNNSSNNLLTIENNDLVEANNKKYNYNYNYSNYKIKNNKRKKNYSNINNNFYRNKTLNIIQTENDDNLIRSFVIYKNEIKPLYSEKIKKNKISKYYHQGEPKKYSYGGKKLKIASNFNNHSYKETIDRSNSRDKIFNKCRVINYTDGNNTINYNYNYDYNFGMYQNYELNKNYELNEPNNYTNNDINNIETNNKEIKKSSSENYLLRKMNKNNDKIYEDYCKRNNNRNNINQDIYKNINYNDYLSQNKKKGDLNEEFKYNNNFNGYNYDNKIINEKNIENNDNYLLLKKGKGYNLSKESSLLNDLNNINNIKDEKNKNINDENKNFQYYYNNKQNSIPKNKRNNSNSYNLDNLNYLKIYHSNTGCNSKKNLLEDFNYENFKLNVKLGLLKKEVYKKEKAFKNKNKKNNDFYVENRKYLENVLNKKKKLSIENILLEKTKKILKEKNIKRVNNNDKNNPKIKNENKILSSIMKSLIENNKRNNNKYIVNPCLNFKS